MILTLKRKIFTDIATIGELFVDGLFQCYILEDRDRGLKQGMSLDEVKKIKVYGETCIPYGTYDVTTGISPRFKKELPIINGITGYSGVLIHTGNRPTDTLGCLITGRKFGISSVSESQLAFDALFPKIKAALSSGDKVQIKIIKHEIFTK